MQSPLGTAGNVKYTSRFSTIKIVSTELKRSSANDSSGSCTSLLLSVSPAIVTLIASSNKRRRINDDAVRTPHSAYIVSAVFCNSVTFSPALRPLQDSAASGCALSLLCPPVSSRCLSLLSAQYSEKISIRFVR